MPSFSEGFYFPENARTKLSAGSYSGLDTFSILRGTGAGWMEGVAVVRSRNIAYCIKLHSARRKLHFQNSMMRVDSGRCCVREKEYVFMCVWVWLAFYLLLQFLLDPSYPDHTASWSFMDSKRRAIHPTGLFADGFICRRAYDMTCMRLVARMYVRKEESRCRKLAWPWKGSLRNWVRRACWYEPFAR